MNKDVKIHTSDPLPDLAALSLESFWGDARFPGEGDLEAGRFASRAPGGASSGLTDRLAFTDLLLTLEERALFTTGPLSGLSDTERRLPRRAGEGDGERPLEVLVFGGGDRDQDLFLSAGRRWR